MGALWPWKSPWFWRAGDTRLVLWWYAAAVAALQLLADVSSASWLTVHKCSALKHALM